MNLWRLVFREIAHRRLNFVLGLVSVSVAVACLVGALTALDAHELSTEEILAATQSAAEERIAARQAEVERAGAELQDAMRVITKGLGFNIFVLPQDQDPSEFDLDGSFSKTMPEEYVERLSKSKIVTINHLLPQVVRKVEWPERQRTIILTGTRGEVPFSHRSNDKKPLQDQVPPGSMVVGYQLHSQLGLKEGERVTLMGREFTVSKLHSERGTADDSTVWINLREAQELLHLENLVNVIQALECNCAAKDRVGEIRQEISAILPGTQVREVGPPALARAEARNTAKETAEAGLRREQEAAREQMEQKRQERDDLKRQREEFAAVLVPLVIVGCAVWVGLLALANVRQRCGEIGILRAIGLRSRQILAIFLSKALFLGLAGGVVGYAAGFAFALQLSGLSLSDQTSLRLFTPELLVLSLLMAPALSGLASWIPAALAARQDPAVVLQGD